MQEFSWEGKRVAFLGDSITEGIGAEGSPLYYDLLRDYLGILPLNYGVNGHRINQCYDRAQQLWEEHGNHIDAVFIFAGTNDYNEGRPLGRWYKRHLEVKELNSDTHKKGLRLKREFVRTRKTVCGSLNLLLGYLKKCYPDKQIILMTPIHRAYAKFGADNIQYDELYPNRLGLYIEDYVAEIRKAADIYSVPLIDLYRNSGLFPLYPEYSKYFHLADTDMLHPGGLGHERIAKTIAAALGSISPEV